MILSRANTMRFSVHTTVAKYMAKRRRPPSQGWKSWQSCRWHCIDGYVRCPDGFVSTIVWTSDPAAFAAGASVAGCDGTSERGMDRPPTATVSTSGDRVCPWLEHAG